jgi:hypothetical protein
MSKKPKGKLDKSGTDINKVWCPDKESFQYIEACEKNCKKKNRCTAFRDYLEPELFS